MNCGSVESLNVSVRWGWSRNAFQIRPMLDRLSPECAAIDVRDQCVASRGVDSRVSTTTCSTCSSPMLRGAPGRGSSTNPSSRSVTNRERHLPTVGRETRSSAATSVLLAPAAQASTIRERSANRWELFGRRAQRASVSPSSSVTTNSAFGRPLAAMPTSSQATMLTSGNTVIRHGHYLVTNLRCRTLERGMPCVRTYGRPESCRTRSTLMALLTFLWVVIMRLPGLGGVGRGRRG